MWAFGNFKTGRIFFSTNFFNKAPRGQFRQFFLGPRKKKKTDFFCREGIFLRPTGFLFWPFRKKGEKTRGLDFFFAKRGKSVPRQKKKGPRGLLKNPISEGRDQATKAGPIFFGINIFYRPRNPKGSQGTGADFGGLEPPLLAGGGGKKKPMFKLCLFGEPPPQTPNPFFLR